MVVKVNGGQSLPFGQRLRSIAQPLSLSDNTGMTVAETSNTFTDAVPEEQPDLPSRFSFVDIFAGIGGMRRGFEAAGGECLFTCEWDRFSQQTYRANFDEEGIAGDIRAVTEADVPPHDLLLAGFPCQPFSLAGVSKKRALNEPHGFACESQGTLFFELARLIGHHRPRAFLLENVKHLLGHDGGRTFEVIRRQRASQPLAAARRERQWQTSVQTLTFVNGGSIEFLPMLLSSNI